MIVRDPENQIQILPLYKLANNCIVFCGEYFFRKSDLTKKKFTKANHIAI